MALAQTKADSLKIKGLVFAQQHGYIPWPAILLDKSHRSNGLVHFVYTNNQCKIPYKRIWPYNEANRKLFVSKSLLEYTEFSRAIYLTDNYPELLLGYQSYREVSQEELHLLHQLRKQHGTLHVEAKFIEEVNTLRRSLTTRQQDYVAAAAAFQVLLELPISQLLLVRSREAVNSIRLLCRFVNPQAEDQTQPKLVRKMANKLMQRFVDCFAEYFIRERFWSEYCTLCSAYKSSTLNLSPTHNRKK